MDNVINQSTVINGEKSKVIIGKDLTGQTLTGRYTLIACEGKLTVTSGNFYLCNCSGLIVTNQNNAATVIRDGYAIGDYYFSANENPASKFGGYWEEVPNGTFLMAAGAGGTADQTGGSADAVIVKHKHQQFGQSNNYPFRVVFYNKDIPVAPVDTAVRLATGTFLENDSGNYEDGNTGYSGVDGAGKNLPPYRTAHIYKRIKDPTTGNL